MTRLWHLTSRTKDAATGLDVENARAGTKAADDPAVTATMAQSAVGVTVVPGFNSPRPNVWIRNEGTTEITDLLVTHTPRSGAPVPVPAPSQRLLPGEACVVALGDHADGEVLVSGTARPGSGKPVEVEAGASVPVEQPADETADETADEAKHPAG